jgi:hypothetical protein
MASRAINWRRLKFALFGFAAWVGISGLGDWLSGRGFDSGDLVVAVFMGGMTALAFGNRRREPQIGDGRYYSEEDLSPNDATSVSQVPVASKTEDDRQLPRAHGRL